MKLKNSIDQVAGGRCRRGCSRFIHPGLDSLISTISVTIGTDITSMSEL